MSSEVSYVKEAHYVVMSPSYVWEARYPVRRPK